MLDRLNRPISEGNFIAYAGTSGRSAVLNFYKIDSVGVDFVRGFKFETRSWLADKGKFNDFSVKLHDNTRMLLVAQDDFALMTV